MLCIKDEYSRVKKVLVFNPSFIGDAILTTPLLKSLNKIITGASLTFCVRPESAPLFKNLGFNVIPFDKRGEYKGVKGIFRFARKLRQEKFDAVISPHKSLRTSLTLNLANIPVRIGYKEAAAAFLYNIKVTRNMKLHEVERILSLIKPLLCEYNLDDVKSLGGLPLTYTDKKYKAVAETFMRVSAEGRPIAGINAGSVWPTKRWPVEKFARLARKLYDDGYAIAIFGGPGDVEVNRKLQSIIGFEYFDYANKVDFSLIPTLVGCLDVLISNDSSPVHIAVSQGVPVVAIFGPTVTELGFAPYGGKNRVVENNNLPCRPCSLHGGQKCPKKHFKCMLDITPEEVFAAVKSLENK